MSLTVSLEALRDDAQIWSISSSVLVGASTSTTNLALSRYDMSFASDAALGATYEQVRLRLQSLLTQGSAQTDKLSLTLQEVRAAYLSTDQSAAAALKGSWDPK